MGVGLRLEIRPMLPGDVAAAAALEAAHQPNPWSKSVFAGELAAEGRSYVVAIDGELIGFGGVMVVGEEAHVMNLLVREESRRRGAGAALLQRLIAESVRLGARHLTLEVRSRNEAARALYARFGLAPVGVRKGYYGDDDALILWARDIDAPGYAKKLQELA